MNFFSISKEKLLIIVYGIIIINNITKCKKFFGLSNLLISDSPMFPNQCIAKIYLQCILEMEMFIKKYH